MYEAVTPAYARLPGTRMSLPSLTVNVAGVMVAGFIDSLKVTVMVGRSTTPVASIVGLVEMTTGGTASELDELAGVVPPPLLHAMIACPAKTANGRSRAFHNLSIKSI
jgi:hypothetical protein